MQAVLPRRQSISQEDGPGRLGGDERQLGNDKNCRARTEIVVGPRCRLRIVEREENSPRTHLAEREFNPHAPGSVQLLASGAPNDWGASRLRESCTAMPGN